MGENPWICNGHGAKVDGECVCSPGYFGRDCTIESTQANRAKYTESDSLSIFNEIVCHHGVWNFDVDHRNVGVLNIEIDGIDDTKYNEVHFQTAIKNWIGVLVDINECDVDLRDYVYNNIAFTVSTNVYYYSSSKSWTDVTDSGSLNVFNKLFDPSYTLHVTEKKTSDGVHEDNIDSTITNKKYSPLLYALSFIFIIYNNMH